MWNHTQVRHGSWTLAENVHRCGGEAAEWMSAMRAADMCVSRPLPSCRRPHRPSSADGLDRIPVREPKCFLVSVEKINTLKWENKPEAARPKQWNQVAPQCVCVCTKPFLPHTQTCARPALLMRRRWHHLWPPTGRRCLVTHTAPLLRAWLWRRTGDEPAVPRARTRTFKRGKSQQSECVTSVGVALKQHLLSASIKPGLTLRIGDMAEGQSWTHSSCACTLVIAEQGAQRGKGGGGHM